MSTFARVARGAVAAGLILLSHPASAFYAAVEPALKVGADCIGKVSLLAPQLTACAVAGDRTRIWCPTGRMFEGATDDRGPAAALARSLCNMAQVP
jgi:hypothetical protein